MKLPVCFLAVAFLLTSCSASNRIFETDHHERQIKTMRLKQTPDARFTEAKDGKSGRSGSRLTLNYLFEGRHNNRPLLSLNVRMTASGQTNQAGSILFFDLDKEEIRIVSEGKSSRLRNHEFRIPENLWVPVANSKDIRLRLYSGKQRVEIMPALPEIQKMKEFFNRAIRQRDAAFPAIPEGLKKW